MSNCLEVNVEFNGKSFPFVLCHRNLEFGDSQQCVYYWQDGRQFRRKIPGSNFNSCIDLWWECAEFQAPGDPDNQQSLVWAEIFQLINTSRGMQNVYLDAVLHAKADRTITFEKQADSRKQQNERTFQLSREERSRVFQIVHSHDNERIGELLDETLLGEQPTDEEQSKLTRAAEVWIGKGVETLNFQGRSGLKNFVNTELKHWIQKLRKVGGDNRLRLF